MRIEIEFAANGAILRVFRPTEGKITESTEVTVFEGDLGLTDAITALWIENQQKNA
jgi:hypothetical protein